MALGCDVRHAARLVYSRGVKLAVPGGGVPLGMGCEVCGRAACPRRAVPAIGRVVEVNGAFSRLVAIGV